MKLLKRKCLIELSLIEAGEHSELLRGCPVEVRGESVRYLVDEEVWTNLMPVEHWNGIDVRPVNASDIPTERHCSMCVFERGESGCDVINCCDYEREDGLSVYFIEVK